MSITTAASAFARPTADTGITHLTQQLAQSDTDDEDLEVGSDHGIPDDVLSIQASGNEEDIGETPMPPSRFLTFCQGVVKNKTQLAPPLPEDISTCFNDIYNSDLSKSTVLTDLLDTVRRPGNAQDVRPTNPGIYNFKKLNMPALCSQDAKLQSSQRALAKSNYVLMQSAATLESSHKKNEVSDDIVGKMLDSCIHAVTLSTMQQLDQVRRDAFKPVLPGDLLPLTKLPPVKHSSLFGDDLKERQKIVQAEAELAETLTGQKHKSKQPWKMRTQKYGPTADKPYSYPARTKYQPTQSTQVRRQKPQRGTVSYSFVNIKFCAGNLRNFHRNWLKLTTDPFVLDIISEGVKLDFIAKLTTPMPILQKIGHAKVSAISGEVEKLLSLGVVVQTHTHQGSWISPIFTTENADGSLRLILNLKKLNDHIRHVHFKMEGLKDVIHMIQLQAWMASVDLKRAYYSVPIHKTCQKYLTFLWKGHY